jgi:glycosyltransferase involved in cell wall biosynthesis
MRPMSVCVVSSWYPTASDPLYGIFVFQFARRLLRSKVPVFVITSSFSDGEVWSGAYEGVPTYRIRPGRLIGVLRLLKSVILLRSARLVHVHASDSFGCVFVLFSRLLGKPTVVTVHRADILYSPPGLYRIIRRLALKLSDRVIAVSFATSELATLAGAPSPGTVIIPNSADELLFKPRPKATARKVLGIEEASKVILFVGNLIPRKRVESIISSLPDVAREVPGCILLVVGDGTARDSLQHLVAALGCGALVRFLGRVPSDKLALCYNAADVFVLPSIHEGQPMVLLEAMASGLPIVTTAVGGNAETVSHMKNGYVLDESALKELPLWIVSILKDEALAQAFGDESLRIYKVMFSESAQIRRMKGVYNSCLRNKHNT